MAKRALIIVAEEAEEMEVVITVDVLRRAGVEVHVAGLDGPGVVTCSRGVKLEPDVALAEARGPYDVVILPGGLGGVRRLSASAAVGALLREREAAGDKVAAICAAPATLVEHGVFRGRRMTSHPSVKAAVEAHATRLDDRVVVDGSLVTSQGPGSAFEFALELARELAGPAKVAEISPGMILPRAGA